jgi:hypothetical protein
MSSSSQEQEPRDPGTGGTQAAAPPRQGHQVPRQSSQYEDTRQYDTTRQYDDTTGYQHAPSGMAIGLTIAAAIMMMVSGAWNFLEGLAAIIRGSYFIVLPNYAFNLSVTGWGWFHLILGAVVFAAGALLFTDKVWARGVAIVVVAVSAIINFLYIPYYPFWSLALIAIDIAVIWALLEPRSRRV